MSLGVTLHADRGLPDLDDVTGLKSLSEDPTTVDKGVIGVRYMAKNRHPLLGHTDFGVYARVIRGGEIALGDEVVLQ